MNTIVDYAKGGVEQVGDVAVAHRSPVSSYENIIAGLLRQKRLKIPVDSSDGVKKQAEAIGIPVSGKSIELLRILSDAQPAGYLSFKGETTHGMISPNYDSRGREKKGTVRFQSVLGGFTIRNGVWLPEAANAIYLAGATGLESKGMGDCHSIPVSKDPEHKLTVIGAISKGDINIAKTHAQHGVRESGGSVASSLTNGQLGNVFAPDSIEGFSGFGKPVELTGNEQPSATFFIPVSYLENPEQAFGAYITDGDITPEQIVNGAGYRAINSRGAVIGEFTKAMEG